MLLNINLTNVSFFYHYQIVIKKYMIVLLFLRCWSFNDELFEFVWRLRDDTFFQTVRPLLTHFLLIPPFHTLWEKPETYVFLMFQGDDEKEYWPSVSSVYNLKPCGCEREFPWKVFKKFQTYIPLTNCHHWSCYTEITKYGQDFFIWCRKIIHKSNAYMKNKMAFKSQAVITTTIHGSKNWIAKFSQNFHFKTRNIYDDYIIFH